jgi:peptide/nickel transport system substrate-binding protein
VATAWRQVDDTTVEFDLRSDVKFHDGTPLTAEDVVYSVKRITNPALKSPQLDQFNKIIGAEIVGPSKVRLKTAGAYPVLLAQLVKLSIVPKAYVEKIGNEQFNQAPMGSGPYKFTAIQRGVKVTLTRNDSYWGTNGPFPAVEFHPVPDARRRSALGEERLHRHHHPGSRRRAQAGCAGQGAERAERARRLFPAQRADRADRRSARA